VVLSHWHDDHVAGNEVFADCEIIALRLTAEALSEHRTAIILQATGPSNAGNQNDNRNQGLQIPGGGFPGGFPNRGR
jgi:glyoxylase-like metal-dependent hydrolase (beta-lactamase superfamily II)